MYSCEVRKKMRGPASAATRELRKSDDIARVNASDASANRMKRMATMPGEECVKQPIEIITPLMAAMMAKDAPNVVSTEP